MTLESWWFFVLFPLLTLIGAVLGVAATLLGGAGGQRQLRRRLDELDYQTAVLDKRVTKEAKARAGEASVAARRSEADVVAEATRLVAEATRDAPSAGKRPSVANLMRR